MEVRFTRMLLVIIQKYFFYNEIGEFNRWKYKSFAKHEFCKPVRRVLIASHRAAAASMGEYIGDRKGVKIGEEESWLDALPPYVHALLPPASIGTGSAFFEGESTTCWARCPAEESRPNRCRILDDIYSGYKNKKRWKKFEILYIWNKVSFEMKKILNLNVF